MGIKFFPDREDTFSWTMQTILTVLHPVIVHLLPRYHENKQIVNPCYNDSICCREN